jgi:hypothetical protein
MKAICSHYFVTQSLRCFFVWPIPIVVRTAFEFLSQPAPVGEQFDFLINRPYYLETLKNEVCMALVPIKLVDYQGKNLYGLSFSQLFVISS